MTDKQIIFDDVDVKDCIAYAKSQTVYLGSTAYKQMEKICMVKNQPCKFFDCQFKQMARELKAKEQECEKLKNIINEAKNSKLDLNSFFAIEATIGEYCLELDRLKAEKQGLIKDWEEKKNLAYEIACKNEKLKQTLTEIKEIAEINPINTCWTVLELCEKCDENKECDIQCPLFKFKLILQKISECEGNDE